ncbi:sugar phosphate isomerase/epimerase [Paenibacillus sp. GYB004]|uniref:sugar phosphate isomerase/epimerase n=1 Tax=Paenibacillus sp. GYB004 TaxID=2994393 RepID=UPI002F9623F6
MRRLQMGMWDKLEPVKWQQVQLDMLNGLEICRYADEKSLREVQLFCERSGIRYGVHGPILGDNGYDLPLLNAPDAEERREAMREVEAQTGIASRYGADYILFHYPYLPVFQPPIRKLYRRLPGERQRYASDRLPRAEFRDISERMFHELAELQHRYKQRILLEHDFFGEYEDIFTDMFLQFREIGLVVDTARLDITRRSFYNFDPYAWIDRLASCVYLVHYSNVRYEEDTFKHHLPVRESDGGDDGCGDAYLYLCHLAERNSAFHLTFEHNHTVVGTDELRDIYRRAAQVCGIRTR